jgi:hypothetical protein
MRVFPIKQNTKTEKEAAKLFCSWQKQCFYYVIHCAANSRYVQELVTVQQMANGNFVKQVVVRRIVWQLIFGCGNRQRSREVNPFTHTVQCTQS